MTSDSCAVSRWLAWLLVGGSLGAAAATYYADPVAGQMSNPGTADQPWGSLEAVVSSGRRFEAGDEIRLRTGHHGAPILQGEHEGEVLIRADDGARATLKRVAFRAARHWRIRGLEISPETAPSPERGVLVRIGRDATAVVVEDCDLHTVRDASAWTAQDWDTRACDGFLVSGPGNVIRGNRLRNVNFGISVSASGVSNLVERNVIENFSGDGLRGLGDYSIFQYNTVKNCYAVNRNHDDGFQSWSEGPGGVGTGVVRGVVLRGNRIVNYEDPKQPLLGTLQGIGCFDGFFEDWVIENNVIITDHWHGITLAGARNCRIVNNTVVDPNATSPGPPWIRIGNHKNGQPSHGNLIRNNLATGYNVTPGAATFDHNLDGRHYDELFVDYAGRDLRLRPGSKAIDAGSSEGVPAMDMEGRARPIDGNGDGRAAWDAGALEHEPVPLPRPR